MSSKVTFKQKYFKQKAFEYIKQIVASNTLLSYAGFNKKIDMHKNSSYLYLEKFIIQEVKLITLHSRKLTRS